MDESAQAQLPLPKTTPLSPKDHAEEVAIFRSTIVGALTTRELDHGELREAFHALAQECRSTLSSTPGHDAERVVIQTRSRDR